MLSRLRNLDLGLFLIRLALAAVFIVHGAGKLGNMEGTVKFFASLDLASFFAYLVAAVETLGGLAMLLGIFTEAAGIGLALVMVFAIYLVKFTTGFAGGWEFDATLLLAALGIVFAGPGRYAVKRFFRTPQA